MGNKLFKPTSEDASDYVIAEIWSRRHVIINEWKKTKNYLNISSKDVHQAMKIESNEFDEICELYLLNPAEALNIYQEKIIKNFRIKNYLK